MKRYKGFQLSWWLTFILSVLLIAGSILFTLVFPYLDLNIATLISQSLILIPLVIGMIMLKINFPYDTFKNMLGIKDFNINFLVPLMLLPVCASYFISYIAAPINIFIYFIFGEYISGVTMPENLIDFFLILTSLCIVAPITEELLFRGIIVKLLDRYGTLFTIIMSSLAFAIVHFNPAGVITTFLLGIIMCILRLGTGSIFSCMMFHMTNNFFAFMLMIFEGDISLPNEVFLPLTIFLAVLFIILMIIFLCFFSNKFYYQGIKEKKGVSVGFIFTMTLFTIFSIATAVSNFFSLVY